MQCVQCGRQWPDDTTSPLGGGCPVCLLEFALSGTDIETAPDDVEPRGCLGPYTLLETLGRGGMGVVYRARHGSLDRVVALKVLHSTWARQPGFAQRFQREGQLLAAVSHPHIVGVYDLGCESGFYYLAMEYVEGRTLRQRMADGRLSEREAVPVIRQLCDALEFAHAHGIIHRDVKPENILVRADGHVKIGDFGIAKLVSTDSAVREALTASSVVLGTRCYMAPEQLERGKEVDHRTDLYALGVVFYEMLTGELPLGVFEPPSRKAPVDTRLDRLILSALEKAPERRPQSARAFQQQLMRITQAAPSGHRGLRPLRWAAALGLVLAAGAVGLIVVQSRGTGKEGVSMERPPMTAAARPTAPLPEEKRGPRILTDHKARVWQVAFSRDGQLLATAGEDRMARLWDPVRGKMLAAIPAFPRGELGYLSLAFSHDGQQLATAGGDNLVRIWDVPGRSEQKILSGHSREVTAVTFAPDGTQVASASHDRSVRLWDATSGKELRTLRGHTDPVLCVAFAADGSMVAAGAMNGAVRLWNPVSGDEIAQCGHGRRVWGVAFAPDGRRFASASHEPSIKLWDLTKKPLAAIVAKDGTEVWSVAFAPDGATLASGSHDGVVRLWDAVTGQLRRRLTGHTAPVVSVAFSPDGRLLASGSWDQTVRLWDLAQP